MQATIKRLAAALFATALTALAACGGPALANVPKPDPGIVAGLAAGVAGAATLADPKGAAARQEQKRPEKEKRPVKNNVTVPGDVLDRLDEKQQHPDASPDETTAPDDAVPAESSGVTSPVPLK